MGRVQGKVAIITGAASALGLGFATARALAREGAKVVLTDLNEEAVLARATELKAAGFEAIAMRQDATREAEWERVVDFSLKNFGRLDVMVNNAGIAVLRWMDVMTLDEFNHQVNVNLNSAFLGSRIALRVFRQQGGGGSIVNISSVVGLVGVPGAAAYAASKGGMRLMSKSIAMECAREQIRVNSVHPGMIMTDMQKVAIRDNPEQLKLVIAAIPAGKLGEPDDIAYCVVYLASDESKYVTGAEFTIDGGMTAS